MVYPNRFRRNVLMAAHPARTAHLSALASYARDHNWRLAPDMMATGGFPRGWTGDGVLAIGNQPALMIEIRQTGLPCVVIADVEGCAGAACVTEDQAQIGRMAADHFLNRAYRSFAWAPLVDDRANRERHAGFVARLAEYGRRCHAFPETHHRGGNEGHGDWPIYRQRLAEELDRLPRPTAILAFNDYVAGNLLDLCLEQGFSVPEEFAILGVGNDPLVGETAPVPLSTIELDDAQMAFRAAELLDRLMDGEPAPEVILVPAKDVIARVSTDATAVADPRVARALVFIAENFSNPMLSVVDVASAVGVSRRNLERGFRQVASCTIREQIVRNRMHEASRLLIAHPRLRITEVAELVGFAGTANFFRTFRQFYGLSPQAHRERTPRPASIPIGGGAFSGLTIQPVAEVASA